MDLVLKLLIRDLGVHFCLHFGGFRCEVYVGRLF
jgi:hypothetical protein